MANLASLGAHPDLANPESPVAHHLPPAARLPTIGVHPRGTNHPHRTIIGPMVVGGTHMIVAAAAVALVESRASLADLEVESLASRAAAPEVERVESLADLDPTAVLVKMDPRGVAGGQNLARAAAAAAATALVESRASRAAEAVVNLARDPRAREARDLPLQAVVAVMTESGYG